MTSRIASFAVLIALAACTNTLAPVRSTVLSEWSESKGQDGTRVGKIEHVIYIIQENRSFDNLFQGYPGADTVSSGKNSKGKTIKLQP